MTEFDFIIIGAGPAGLAAAQYAARANLKTALFDGGATGGQVVVINDLENYPGVFPPLTGYDFIDNMKKQALAFGVEFVSESITAIDKSGNQFVLTSDKGMYKSFAVLLATGAYHKTLGIPGESEFYGRGVSYCATCDGPFFRGKRIAVVGGGDSACDEANFLSQLTTNVTLIHRRETLRAQAAVAERVLKNPNITKMFNYSPLEIYGTNKVESILLRNTLTGEEVKQEADAVFIFVGTEPKTDLAQTLKKDENGYIITDETMQTSVKGFFCAGDVRSKPFRQVVTATADGAVAAHCAGKYIETVKETS